MKTLKYISTDVEYSWWSWSELWQWSLLSIGSCVVWDINRTFYEEIKPINNIYSDEAIQVIKKGFKKLGDDLENTSSQEILDKLEELGVSPKEAFNSYKLWLENIETDKSYSLQEIACPIKFDWGLTSYYFREFIWDNPLGYSWKDWNSILQWFLNDTNASFKKLGIKWLDEELPHNALQDSQIQAVSIEFLLKIIDENRKNNWELVTLYLSHWREALLSSKKIKQYVDWVWKTVESIRSTPFDQTIDYKSILW